MELGDILHDGHMEVACLLGRTTFLWRTVGHLGGGH
jgi:hypothetical protein